ncbi:MAG: ThuA domain-containing protein [Promethearchaeia archaeon]
MTTQKKNSQKILLYQGGRYFFKKRTYRYFQKILDEYTVDMYKNVEIFSTRDFIEEYDTTIFFSQWGEFTETQERNVLDFVSQKGFVGLHGASASFKEHPKYFKMLGGRFVDHKSKTTFDVQIVDNNHPITKELDNFQFYDEPYRHDFSMGGDIHVLAKADYHDPEDPELEPIMWTKIYNGSRVFFCALGHKAKSLKEPIFQKIIRRSVKWVLAGNNGGK